jgi:hypothetical protein
VWNACAFGRDAGRLSVVNFKQEPDMVARIAKVLQAEEYNAIREVGAVPKERERPPGSSS